MYQSTLIAFWITVGVRETSSPVPGSGIMLRPIHLMDQQQKGSEKTWLTNGSSADCPNLICGCGKK